MRFTTILFAGAFAVLANAQSSSETTLATTTPSASATTTYSLTPAQSSQAACLGACEAGDVDCQSQCIAVPNPDASAVNSTTECVAACPQGNGTAAETQNYADCVNACIGQYYYSASGGTPQATGSSGTTGTGAAATATGTGSKTTGTGSTTATASGSDASGSASGTASESTTSSAAADAVHVAGSAVGLLGFMAAVLAI